MIADFDIIDIFIATFLIFVHRHLNTHTFSRINCTVLYFSHFTVNYLGVLNLSSRFELIGINQVGIDSQKVLRVKVTWEGNLETENILQSQRAAPDRETNPPFISGDV